MRTSGQLMAYVDSFRVVEFLGFDSIMDILPKIHSIDIATQDGRDLKTWKDFFTSTGTPWLLLKVEENKINKKGNMVERINYKLWKKREVEEGIEERINISSLFPGLLPLKSDNEMKVS